MTDGRILRTDRVPAPAFTKWRILVVDDDPDVHTVTHLSLHDFSFEARGVEWLSAYSAGEARGILETQPDIALILLDVVMETGQAGLELVRHVREVLKNRAVRIVMRTGEAGAAAPPLAVIEQYEVDDFQNKTELTFERMTIVVKAALRNYRLLREIEAQRRALENSNEELRRFSYVASHDMKTPLRSIVSCAELLEKRYADRVEPADRELLQFVVQGASDLYALVESLLEFSRLGVTHADFQPVDLNAVVCKALSRLQGVIQERQARVDCGPLPTVPGNTIMLEQLFRNLIENGLKFQPGPEPSVRITAVASKSDWEIRVADSGIGIEAQYLLRIFEPFQRLHTRDQYAGSGVGLAICRKVAQIHGGAIRAMSSPGNGTTMVVTLPGAVRK